MTDPQRERASKFCPHCNRTLPISRFPRNRSTRDGRQSYCQECKSALERKRAETPAGKLQRQKYWQEYKARNPEKVRARYRKTAWHRAKNGYRQIPRHNHTYAVPAVKNRARVRAKSALKSGKLIRPKYCLNCGVICVPDMHHPDYSKPLDIIWLCKFCHGITRRKDEAARSGLQLQQLQLQPAKKGTGT